MSDEHVISGLADARPRYTVTRSQWLCASTMPLVTSVLWNRELERGCCLGHIGLACGLTKERIEGKYYPEHGIGNWPEELFHDFRYRLDDVLAVLPPEMAERMPDFRPVAPTWYRLMAYINDRETIDSTPWPQSERERVLTALADLVGFDLVFVD